MVFHVSEWKRRAMTHAVFKRSGYAKYPQMVQILQKDLFHPQPHLLIGGAESDQPIIMPIKNSKMTRATTELKT